MPSHAHTLFRRGSRKNVDRFTGKRAPKAQASRGVEGHVPRKFSNIFASSILPG